MANMAELRAQGCDVVDELQFGTGESEVDDVPAPSRNSSHNYDDS